MHYHEIQDDNGDTSDVVPFCSDACHLEWCEARAIPYGGWNGVHDGADNSEYCASCGVIASCGESPALASGTTWW